MCVESDQLLGENRVQRNAQGGLDVSLLDRYGCVAILCHVLQCVAVCCSVLQCVAVCCSVLQPLLGRYVSGDRRE